MTAHKDNNKEPFLWNTAKGGNILIFSENTEKTCQSDSNKVNRKPCGIYLNWKTVEIIWITEKKNG